MRARTEEVLEILLGNQFDYQVREEEIGGQRSKVSLMHPAPDSDSTVT